MTAPVGRPAGDPGAELDVQLRDAVDLAVELVGRVRRGDGAGTQQLLEQLGPARLGNLAVAMAHLVDDAATVPQLRGRLGEGVRLAEALEVARCAPELWGESVNSRAVHGTRSRYVAGCRGALCVDAERTYQRNRKRTTRKRVGASA